MSAAHVLTSRYSETGRRVEKFGRDVVFTGIGGTPEGDKPYRQLGRMLGSRVIIMGKPLFEGEETPPSSMKVVS